MGEGSAEEQPTTEEEPEDNKEKEKVDESIIEYLRNIKESEEFTFKKDENNSIIIDSEQANRIVAVYETLNKNNKDSFREMLKESRSSFIKILNFSFDEQLSITGDSQDESR